MKKMILSLILFTFFSVGALHFLNFSVVSAQVPVILVFQNAATTGNGTTFRVDSIGINKAIAVEWSTGVTAGVVELEEAMDSTYTGTWDSLGSSTFVADTTEFFHLTGLHRHIRARITTNVVGGTVTVRMISRD